MKFYCHLTKPRAVDGDVSLVEVSALGAGSGGWIWGQGSHFPVRIRDVLLITLSRLQRGGREAGGRQLSTARPGRGCSVWLSPQIHRRFLFLMIFSAAVPSYSLFYHKTKCVGRPLTLLARPRIGGGVWGIGGHTPVSSPWHSWGFAVTETAAPQESGTVTSKAAAGVRTPSPVLGDEPHH